MKHDSLIRMANQIGTFFESMPDQAEALSGIASHLRKFWDPRMRRALLNLCEGPHAEELSEIVRQAVRRHGLALE